MKYTFRDSELPEYWTLEKNGQFIGWIKKDDNADLLQWICGPERLKEQGGIPAEILRINRACKEISDLNQNDLLFAYNYYANGDGEMSQNSKEIVKQIDAIWRRLAAVKNNKKSA